MLKPQSRGSQQHLNWQYGQSLRHWMCQLWPSQLQSLPATVCVQHRSSGVNTQHWVCCHRALSAVLRSCNPALKICCRTWNRMELHFLPRIEEINVLPLPLSLSFAAEPTQFDIFNNFKQTCYIFPKSWFTVWKRKFSRAENPWGKNKNLAKLWVFGNCLLQLKNKVKSKLGGDKEGSVAEPDTPKERCLPASAFHQPSTATLWEQEMLEQLQETGSQISLSWIRQNITEC